MFITYLLIGAAAGVLSGLLGIGGGVIVIPALIKVFLAQHIIPADYIMHMAIGTSLAIVIVTASSALYSHAMRRAVRWDFVKAMVPGLILGAIGGAIIADSLSSFYLRILFSVFLFFIGLRLLFAKQSKSSEQKHHSRWVLFFFSILISGLSSILGLGGGILLIPFLIYYRVDFRFIAGTSVACGLIIGVVATASFLTSGLFSAVSIPSSTGYIYWPAFLGVAVASMLTAPLGVALGHRMPTMLLRRLFGVFLLVMACDMLFT